MANKIIAINVAGAQAPCRKSKSTISLTLDDLGHNIACTWGAVEEQNDPPVLFHLGSDPVMVNPDDGTFRVVTPVILGRFAVDNIDFYIPTEEGEEKTIPSDRLFRYMLAGPTTQMPELHGVTPIPTFGADGDLHYQPGYSNGTRLFYAPGSGFEIPWAIDPDEVEQAKDLLLRDLLVDFPFDDDASKAHAVAAILLPFVRPMITGPTPLFLLSKPKAGTGATLLAEVLSLPGAGMPKVITLPTAEEERRRTLFSALRECPGAILLDNATDLKGAALASVLTQTSMTDRVVGSSSIASTPNRALWTATGNNPELSDENARRVIRIHLDAHIEHPERRNKFRHSEIKQWAAQHRAYLVWAALTMIHTWVAAGRPAGSKNLGSFESWSEITSGILETCGIDGFLGNLDTSRTDGDSETRAIRGFILAWAEEFGCSDEKASELLPLASNLDLGDGSERSRCTRLGKLLELRRGQQFGKWVITRGRSLHGYDLWKLEKSGQ